MISDGGTECQSVCALFYSALLNTRTFGTSVRELSRLLLTQLKKVRGEFVTSEPP